jgi:hypothetical protein
MLWLVLILLMLGLPRMALRAEVDGDDADTLFATEEDSYQSRVQEMQQWLSQREAERRRLGLAQPLELPEPDVSHQPVRRHRFLKRKHGMRVENRQVLRSHAARPIKSSKSQEKSHKSLTYNKAKSGKLRHAPTRKR